MTVRMKKNQLQQLNRDYYHSLIKMQTIQTQLKLERIPQEGYSGNAQVVVTHGIKRQKRLETLKTGALNANLGQHFTLEYPLKNSILTLQNCG